MNTRLNSVPGILIPALALLAAASSLNAGVVANTKEGIAITAEASSGPPGKTRITCTLTNNSPHTLASVHRRSPCLCFQFKLLDAKGNWVPQEREWADVHRQDEPTLPENAKIGISEIWIAPSASEEFYFDLEDAYGARAAIGRTLEVTWRNTYSGPKAILRTSERKDGTGKVIPAHEELHHFPGLWTVSVSLPLPERPGADAASPTTEEIFRITTQEKPAPPSSNAQAQIPSAQPPPGVAQAPATRWWWALVAIPLLLLAWLGMRLRNPR